MHPILDIGFTHVVAIFHHTVENSHLLPGQLVIAPPIVGLRIGIKSLVGQIVRYCIENNKVLEDMSIEEYRNFSPVFDEELYEDISLEACVAKRCSTGGTAPSSLERQIGYIQNLLGFSAAE